MRYESAKTEKGNVGVSYDSQEAADLQAVEMDENGCTDCTDCTSCTDCTDCTSCAYCANCNGCRYCIDCNGCRYCANCTSCTSCANCTSCTSCASCANCTSCTSCANCTGCTNTKGALRWNGEPAKNLLSLNGLRWPVSTDGKSIQIGCQHHSVDGWRAFDDRMIARMDSGALEFWKAHKDMVMGLAEVRKSVGGSDE